MKSRDDVIKGLETCEMSGTREDCEGYGCPYFIYNDEVSDDCQMQLFGDTLALLKAQEPRVMTLGGLRDIGSVWELNTPPYLWMEINPTYRWTRGCWVAWREIYDMIDGLHPTYDADNYGKIWRCWTSRPDKATKEATPWE